MPDRVSMEQEPWLMQPGRPVPGERYTPTPWRRLARFADHSSLQERVLFHSDGSPSAIETRIFESDGSLRPLPGERRSRADADVVHHIDRT